MDKKQHFCFVSFFFFVPEDFVLLKRRLYGLSALFYKFWQVEAIPPPPFFSPFFRCSLFIVIYFSLNLYMMTWKSNLISSYIREYFPRFKMLCM